MEDHVIICGLGSIGFRTFELLRGANQQIVVISDSTTDEWRWQIENDVDAIFLLGDARDDNILIKAGIRSAKAILTLTNHDIVNVSIAMDARNLNSSIKIIMRMFDNELGIEISKALGIHQVFSTSELTAPIFATSIHDNQSITQFKMNGKDYFVSENTENTNRITSGSFILHEYFSNKIEQNKPIQLYAHLAESYKKKRNKLFFHFSKLNYLLSPVFANFRRLLFVLLCVILASALTLHWAMSLNYIDALYFVTTTVTTVGYGDFNFSQSGTLLKLFGCILMISGASALAILFSSITEILLSRKLPNILGGRPLPKKDHVIVVGAGPIGQKLISLLLEDQIPIVILEGDEKDHYAQDINRKVALVDGFLKSNDTLKRANIHTAKAIVVITDDDVENLSVSMAARKINPNLINILHIFNPKLGEKLKSSLSLDTVLCVPKIVAPYFAASVLGDKILLAIEWKNRLIYLSQKNDESEILTEDHLELNGVLDKTIQIRSIPLIQSMKR